MPRFTLALLAIATASACTSKTAHPTLKPEGDPCTEDSECDTGLCIQLQGQGQKCGRKCTEGCKTDGGEICTQLGYQRYACVPDRGAGCTPCTTNSDCPYSADSCIVVNGAHVCGQDCSYDGLCGTDFHCDSAFDVLGNQVPAQCQPKSGTCGCNSASYGQTLSCAQTTDAGTCMGTSTCGPEGYSACSAPLPSLEICNGLDDDCNGAPDDNLGDTTCGVGECKRTVANCANGFGQTCVPGPPNTEKCDGLDNDCDGTPDNGIDFNDILHCGTCTPCTVAHGTPKCDTGTCGVQSCTAPYADCKNGYADGCETDTDNDSANCGACNHSCAGANGSGMCVGGHCTLTCTAGFYDIDGDPSNGCEYACTFVSATDFPDLQFKDDNCDGIDGERSNGIFVSPIGNDANAGTSAAQPMQTISAAIIAATAKGKRDVYIALGTYNETVTLANGVNLYGGYDPTSKWTRALQNVSIINSSAPVGVTMTGLSSALEVQLMTIKSANATGVDSNGDGQSSIGVRVLNSAGGLTLKGCTIQPGSGSSGNGMTAAGDGTPGGPGGDAQGTGGSSSPGGGGTSACGAPGGPGGAPGNGGNGGTVGGDGTTAPGGAAGTSGGGGGGYPGSNTNGGMGITPANGGAGSGGMNGAAGASFGGVTAGGAYSPATGGNGTVGQVGGGGGGAGGGSGMKRNSGSFGCSSIDKLTGGYGGGGGGGGCGGALGIGGRGGGGSFGVVAVGSAVSLPSTSVSTGNGGSGGVGGAGGRGGGGGAPGGTGAQPECESGGCPSGCGGVGGTGAWGGNGGNGGGGSGGGGGPSVCVVTLGTAAATGGMTCTHGAGGPGGNGGLGDGVNAPPGNGGQSTDVVAL